MLIGLVVGYVAAIPFGMVNFSNVASAQWIAIPEVMKYGFDFQTAAILGMCIIAVVSAIETIGDINGITKGGANRDATDKEISGGTMADGLGSAIASLFGGMPNTSYSQNVGLVAMTGVMSRHVVTIGAIFLIAAGLIPKIGALVAAMPNPVLGGAAIVMFGMITGAGIKLLNDVNMNRRNMMIIALSLAIGLGLKSVPEAVKFAPQTLKILLTSGLFPAALIAVVLNLLLPEEI